MLGASPDIGQNLGVSLDGGSIVNHPSDPWWKGVHSDPPTVGCQFQDTFDISISQVTEMLSAFREQMTECLKVHQLGRLETALAKT